MMVNIIMFTNIIAEQHTSIAIPLTNLLSVMVGKELHTELKGSYHLMYSFFFLRWAAVFDQLSHLCDTTRATEREVLAPGAGHRGASGLISSQVIRAGTRWDRRRQTEWKREGEERGLWDRSVPAGVGLFSRGTPAVLDRHAEGR